MAAVARGRQLRITYGTAAATGTIGTSTLHFRDVHRLRVTPDSFEIVYTVLLVSPTRAAFETDLATLEGIFDTPRQPVLVEVLTPATQAVLHTLLSFSHTGNTGLNIRAERSKPGLLGDTVVSRLLEITVTGGRPATYLTQAGLRTDFEYDVQFSASRRGTLIVRGTYTAVGGVTAEAQYKANIDARVLTITTGLTGAWAIAAERYTPDDTNQVVRFTRTYKELLHNESAGLLDHPAVSDQQLTINRIKTTADHTPGSNAAGLVTIVANFTAAIDKNVIKGVAALDTLWVGTLRPWILTNVRSTVASRGFAVVRDGYTVDPVENVLRATLTVQAVVSRIISRLVTTDDDVDFGKIIRKTWPENAQDDLEPTPGYTFRGPKTLIRIVRTATRTHGDVAALLDAAGGSGGGGQLPPAVQGNRPEGGFGLGISTDPIAFLNFGAPGGADGGAAANASSSRRFERLRLRQQTIKNEIGLPGERQLVTDTVVTETFELIGPVPAGGGGAGEKLPDSRTRTR